MKNRKDFWYEDKGLARTVLYYKGCADLRLTGVGIAECHPEEKHKSEITGTSIAELRASIDILQQIKKYEVKPGLAALRHLYGTMKESKHYNPDSYEARRLMKEIKNYEKEVASINEQIDVTKQYLKDYINGIGRK